jgi:ubiquinone/menaquinone biosynthesis C-methylase UbiE
LGLWERRVLPILVDRLCANVEAAQERAKLVPKARGVVLEVGFGTGHNLPFYDAARVERVIGVEPSQGMLARAQPRRAAAPFPVELLALEGERIPLPAASVDTVVTTWTLCSIPGVEVALEGMRRALRPGGQLLFCEHGLAPDAPVARWQARLEPLWRRAFGGCRLGRDVAGLLEAAGFRIETVEAGYLAGPRFVAFHTRGVARPA